MIISRGFLVVSLGVLTCRAAPRPVAAATDSATSHTVAVLPPAVEVAPPVCPPRLPRFEAYPVDSVYQGNPVWPKITLGPDSFDLDMRADLALAHAYGRGPDFAGYLAIVESGCGSPCQVQTLVDVRAGKIVGTTTSSLGTAYRVDSRLLIVNPMDSTQCYDTLCTYCRPVYYAWNGAGLDSIW